MFSDHCDRHTMCNVKRMRSFPCIVMDYGDMTRYCCCLFFKTRECVLVR